MERGRPFGGHVPRVIVEGNPLSDDEEDKIVEGAVFDQIVGDFSLNDDVSTEEAEQGKLVEQIRSAQKKLDPSADTVRRKRREKERKKERKGERKREREREREREDESTAVC